MAYQDEENSDEVECDCCGARVDECDTEECIMCGATICFSCLHSVLDGFICNACLDIS